MKRTTTRDYKQHKRKPLYPRESSREKALKAQRDDLVTQLDSALELLHDKDDDLGCLEILAEQRRLDLVGMRNRI